jgi:hypothetical protein
MTKKSPVVCWTSKWVNTGKVEKLKMDNGEFMYRPTKKLEYVENPHWRPRVKIDK